MPDTASALARSGPESPVPDLGILGVGLLGSALAERALAAGIAVIGYDPDLRALERLQGAGGSVAGSAPELARACRRILLALPDERTTRVVLESLGDALTAGTLVLDATTGSPESAREFAALIAHRNGVYLEMTVSGSSTQVRRGDALFMVGGPLGALESCRDLLAAFGGRTLHTGESGTASAMKLVTNLVLGLNRAALAEGLVLASSLGLARERALEALKTGAASSRVMDTKGAKMLRGDFEPEARLAQHLKDVRLMLKAAARTGQRLPLTEIHRDLLEQGEQLGMGGLDNSAILRVLESQQSPAQSSL